MMQLECQAIIFDLDGVLVDSIPGVLRIWREWARIHGLNHPDLDTLAITARTEEAVQQLVPHLDVFAEVQYLEEQEATAIEGLRPISGAAFLLKSLPPESWSVFTSVRRETALAKLRAANLPEPRILISGDQVQHGKPAPHGYLLAAEQIGVDPRECLVVEDTPVGIEAAAAGGIPVIALATTHSPEKLIGAQVILSDLNAIQVTVCSSTALSKPDDYKRLSRIILDLHPIL
ncbi:MAG: HAD-IA family hydrolase [Anaerolineales bacterium]